MKSRLIIFIGLTMLATLSFTLVSVQSDDAAPKKQEVSTESPSRDSEPAGGFVIEDRF